MVRRLYPLKTDEIWKLYLHIVDSNYDCQKGHKTGQDRQHGLLLVRIVEIAVRKIGDAGDFPECDKDEAGVESFWGYFNICSFAIDMIQDHKGSIEYQHAKE